MHGNGCNSSATQSIAETAVDQQHFILPLQNMQETRCLTESNIHDRWQMITCTNSCAAEVCSQHVQYNLLIG